MMEELPFVDPSFPLAQARIKGELREWGECVNHYVHLGVAYGKSIP